MGQSVTMKQNRLVPGKQGKAQDGGHRDDGSDAQDITA
jgi:hypothetical protein